VDSAIPWWSQAENPHPIPAGLAKPDSCVFKQKSTASFEAVTTGHWELAAIPHIFAKIAISTVLS